MHYCCYCRYR